MGDPDDVAFAALFLLSDDSIHVTGTELVAPLASLELGTRTRMGV